MNNMDKLELLRIQLYTAAQSLQDEELEYFWGMLEDILKTRISLQDFKDVQDLKNQIKRV